MTLREVFFPLSGSFCLLQAVSWFLVSCVCSQNIKPYIYVWSLFCTIDLNNCLLNTFTCVTHRQFQFHCPRQILSSAYGWFCHFCFQLIIDFSLLMWITLVVSPPNLSPAFSVVLWPDHFFMSDPVIGVNQPNYNSCIERYGQVYSITLMDLHECKTNAVYGINFTLDSQRSPHLSLWKVQCHELWELFPYINIYKLSDFLHSRMIKEWLPICTTWLTPQINSIP